MVNSNISIGKKVLYLLTALILSTLAIRFFVLDSFVVIGDSMAPALTSGDYVFVNKLAYIRNTPSRGDIVVVNFREMSDKKAIKRVVGLPNEWLFIENGTIYVTTEREGNRTEVGKLDTETYTADLSKGYSYRLDPHEYFLMGDNGLVSVDSRDLGPVDVYDIEGKVVKRIRI